MATQTWQSQAVQPSAPGQPPPPPPPPPSPSPSHGQYNQSGTPNQAAGEASQLQSSVPVQPPPLPPSSQGQWVHSSTTLDSIQDTTSQSQQVQPRQPLPSPSHAQWAPQNPTPSPAQAGLQSHQVQSWSSGSTSSLQSSSIPSQTPPSPSHGKWVQSNITPNPSIGVSQSQLSTVLGQPPLSPSQGVAEPKPIQSSVASSPSPSPLPSQGQWSHSQQAPSSVPSPPVPSSLPSPSHNATTPNLAQRAPQTQLSQSSVPGQPPASPSHGQWAQPLQPPASPSHRPWLHPSTQSMPSPSHTQPPASPSHGQWLHKPASQSFLPGQPPPSPSLGQPPASPSHGQWLHPPSTTLKPSPGAPQSQPVQSSVSGQSLPSPSHGQAPASPSHGQWLHPPNTTIKPSPQSQPVQPPPSPSHGQWMHSTAPQGASQSQLVQSSVPGQWVHTAATTPSTAQGVSQSTQGQPLHFQSHGQWVHPPSQSVIPSVTVQPPPPPPPSIGQRVNSGTPNPAQGVAQSQSVQPSPLHPHGQWVSVNSNAPQAALRPSFTIPSNVTPMSSASGPVYRASTPSVPASENPQPVQTPAAPSSSGLLSVNQPGHGHPGTVKNSSSNQWPQPPPLSLVKAPPQHLSGSVPGPPGPNTSSGSTGSAKPPEPSGGGSSASAMSSGFHGVNQSEQSINSTLSSPPEKTDPSSTIVSSVHSSQGQSGSSSTSAILETGPVNSTPDKVGHSATPGPPLSSPSESKESSTTSGPPGIPVSVPPPGVTGSSLSPSVVPCSSTASASVSSVSPGLSCPTGPPKPPASARPLGLSTPSVSGGVTSISGQPDIPGLPGLSSSPLTEGIRPVTEGLISNPRPGLSSASPLSTVPPPSVPLNPVNPLVPQPPYQPYMMVPPVAPQLPWMAQSEIGSQNFSYAPYGTAFPGSYPGQVRPVGLSIAPRPSVTPINSALATSGEQISAPGVSPHPMPGPGVQFPRYSMPPSVQNSVNLASNPAIKQHKFTGEIESRNAEDQVKSDSAVAWSAHKTADGLIYYYNSVTGQSTYDRPPEFHVEPEKVTTQPTPVSWEKLSNTDWAVVNTNDGRKYYYNTKTQVTSWQVPPEVAQIQKSQVAELSKSNVVSVQTVASMNEKGLSMKVQNSGLGSSALDLVKKKLQDSSALSGNTVPSNPSSSTSINGAGVSESKAAVLEGDQGKNKDSVANRSSSDSSSESEDDDPGPTKEELVAQFKEMLKEKAIAPFSKWEKELPKILFDPRFQAIPNYLERRNIFDQFVRTRADEERKEKRAAQKAAIEGFKQLLDEAAKDITRNMNYDTFSKLWGHDPRFKALDRKDRETLLNERVSPLRKAEEERVKAVLAAAASGFKSMLREIKEINASSRWSRVKDNLRHDPRYKTVKREDREAMFNEYISELRDAELAAERAAKAKREEEDKLREREREMRKRKEREGQELDRVRSKARRKDAITAYQSLLTEKIKDPGASWTEWKPKVERDPLGRATNPELDPSDRERLFRDHINELFERCVREYRILLADVITPEAVNKHMEEGNDILSSWSDAKKLLKHDLRYSKMPHRDREIWWNRYADSLQRRLKTSNNKDEKMSEGSKATGLDTIRSPGHKRISSHR